MVKSLVKIQIVTITKIGLYICSPQKIFSMVHKKESPYSFLVSNKGGIPRIYKEY